MPNITVSNLSGTTVQLFSGSELFAVLPSGFTESIKLDGTYLVTIGGSVSITTSNNIVPLPPVGGQCNVTVVGDGGGGGLLLVNGAARYPAAWPVGAVIDFSYGGHASTLGIVPASYDAQLVILGVYPLITSTITPITTYTNATRYTNVIGGEPVGSFKADGFTKSVAVLPSSVSTHSYEFELATVTAGFVFGMGLLVFLYVVRVLRGLAGQGGDF